MFTSPHLRHLLFLCLCAVTFAYVADANAALKWGNVGSKCEGTRRVDYARLWGLAPGTDWVGICRRTRAVGISGRANGKVPSRCVQHVDGSVWGEWRFSNHVSCKPKSRPAPPPPSRQNLSWGNIGAKCDNGARVEYARLWGLRPGQDWLGICRGTVASNVSQLSNGKVPSRCVQHVDRSVWGEWKYSGHPSCSPRWGKFKKDNCVRQGYRQYSSRIWEAGADPMQTCARTPATINGQRLAAPTRCKTAIDGGVWGEFDVPDTSCPFWGNELGRAGIVRGECVALETRKYYARLWDVAATSDWNGACHAEATTIAGVTTGPLRCVNKGPFGMWGEWLVKDTACTLDKLPRDARFEAIARAKLAEMGDDILSGIDLATRINQDPKVASALQSGTPQTIAASAVRASDGTIPAVFLGHRTLTVGAVVDAKLIVVGGTGESGAAIDLSGSMPVYAYASVGYSFGPGLSGGGGVDVGLWVCQVNKIGGDGWGFVFGLDDIAKLKTGFKEPFKPGLSISIGLWFSYPDENDPNSVPEYRGITFSPTFGKGVDFGGLTYVTTAVDGDETVECDGKRK